jgi:hypothetical protein
MTQSKRKKVVGNDTVAKIQFLTPWLVLARGLDEKRRERLTSEDAYAGLHISPGVRDAGKVWAIRRGLVAGMLTGPSVLALVAYNVLLNQYNIAEDLFVF